MELHIDRSSTVSATSDQVSGDLSGDSSAETVILQLSSGTYYQLDRVGARVWALIRTPTSVQAVLDRLLEEYDVSAAKCEADLIALLRRLASEKLVDIQNGAHT